MYLSTAMALASSAGLAAAHPLGLSSRDVAGFPAGTSWDISLNRGGTVTNVDIVNEKVQVIDIDLFDTDKATIKDLKANKQVICYFSAGSREDWRPDASDFEDGDTGKGLDGWPGENWVNVKSENVRNIMKKRIQMAADNGCTAIDPDNVDGFGDNQDGFGYDKSAYVDYIEFMAQEAKNLNLAIGLKNAIDIIPDVVDVVQFAVNERCHEYSECTSYKPFTDVNKAVFNIEYGGNSCDSPSGVKLSTLIKPEDQGLNTLGGACAGQEAAQPAASQTTPVLTQTPSPTPTRSSTQPTPTSSDEEEEESEDEDEEEEEPAPTSTGRARKPWQY